MMAITAGSRVTWKKGYPLANPFPSNHLVFDSVGRVLRFDPVLAGVVFVEWSAPVVTPSDPNPVWRVSIDSLEEAVVVPGGAAPPAGGKA